MHTERTHIIGKESIINIIKKNVEQLHLDSVFVLILLLQEGQSISIGKTPTTFSSSSSGGLDWFKSFILLELSKLLFIAIGSPLLL